MPAPPSITRTPPASCDRHPWVFDSQDDSQVREPSRTTADVSGLLAQVSILSGHQQMLADARTAVFKTVCGALLRRPGWVRFPSIPASLAACDSQDASHLLSRYPIENPVSQPVLSDGRQQVRSRNGFLPLSRVASPSSEERELFGDQLVQPADGRNEPRQFPRFE